MAQDGYYSAPERQQQPQPMNSYPEPKHSQPAGLHPTSAFPHLHYSQSERQLYRDGSPSQKTRMDAEYQRTRQPINDAITSAVGTTEASNALHPDVLNQITSQITASVIQQLKANNLDNSALNPGSSTPAPTTALPNGVTSSSSVQSDSSPSLSHRKLYTPPSPHRPLDDATFNLPTSPAKSTHSGQRRRSSNDDRSTNSPSTSARRSDEAPMAKAERPPPPQRKPTDITTLEKIWGPLFEGSRPTARLGQFLRGLALHLIQDYEPKCSLVITPSKMLKYYEDAKLTSETYPWQMVFDDRTSSISRLYREVEAQHHLVQDRMDERPDIPGLTPLGFERWSTLMLLAYPDQEFERLQKAVLDMPICNFDDPKERFPKEISRRLFPKIADHGIRDKLERAVVTHCNVSLLNRWTSGSEQATQQQSTPVTSHKADSIASATSSQPPVPIQGSSIERERQPYSTTPSEGAIEEEDDIPTPQPIERERKPYTAQPGCGKYYEDINRPPTPPDPRANMLPSVAASATPSATLRRSGSVASGTSRPTDSQRIQPIPVNPNQYSRQPTQSEIEGHSMAESVPNPRHRANSVLSHHPTTGRSVRHRSPSANAKGGGGGGGGNHPRAESEGTSGPTSYTSYNPAPSGDLTEDARRQRDYERHYPPDRHEASRPSMYEMPIRDREPRPRYQSSAGYGGGQYSSDEDYYRPTGGRSHNGGYDGQQYYR